MKQFTAILLTVCAVFLFATAAFAEKAAPEAKITVQEKLLVTFEGKTNAFFFAKVQNTGDAAGYVEYNGKIVGFDADDNVIVTEDYVCTAPSRVYLESGEYAYVRETFYEDALKTSTVADYKFSTKAAASGMEYEKLASEAVMEYDPEEEYDNYVYVTFTNTMDEIIYDYVIVVALYDQNGALMFVKDDLTSGIGLHPGSTITVMMYVDSDMVKHFKQASLTPTTVDSLVYCELEN